jgi:hypothetical protein
MGKNAANGSVENVGQASDNDRVFAFFYNKKAR